MLCALGIIWLAATAARVTWLVAVPPTMPTGDHNLAMQAQQAHRASRPMDRIDVDGIVSRQHFGQSRAAPAPRRPAPETKLNLSLDGVYHSSTPAGSIAIISSEGEPAALYRVGDRIGDQARVTEIRSDRVVLDRGTRREVLTMDTPSVDAALEDASRDGEPDPGGRAEDASGASKAEGTSDTSALRRQQRRLLRDPQRLTRLLRGRPVRDEADNVIGYRLPGQTGAAVFKQTGLKAGDVITAVGDTRLKDPSSARDALRRLGQQSRVRLTIRRDGQSRQLTIDVGG